MGAARDGAALRKLSGPTWSTERWPEAAGASRTEAGGEEIGADVPAVEGSRALSRNVVQMGRAGSSSPPWQQGKKPTFSCVEEQVGGYLVHQYSPGAAFPLSHGPQEDPSQAPCELQGFPHEPAASLGNGSAARGWDGPARGWV